MRAAPRLIGYRLGSPMSAIYPPEYQQSPSQPSPLPPHRNWPRRHKILTALGFGLALALAACGTTKTVTAPAQTIIQYSPGPTVTETQTVTETVTPTANAAGQATTISDGVWVVGKDMAAGTYHTSGGNGNQCYYATLRSTNTQDIISNNLSSGPGTFSTSGAYAVDLSGGCQWTRE